MMNESKEITKKLIYDISKKFHVQNVTRKKVVPHITLFGPFTTKSIRDVINSIGEIASKYSSLEYEIDGFDYFESKKKFLFITTDVKKNVIFLNITPTEELKKFRYELAKKLLKITGMSTKPHDSKKEFSFHATLAMKDINQKFDDIWEYLQDYDIKSRGISYRITLLKNQKIMYEYELPTKRLLNRNQALGNNNRTRRNSITHRK